MGRGATVAAGNVWYQFDELYMDTVQTDTTPSHVMTVKDSLYLLELCLAGREMEAEELLAGLLKTQSPYVSERKSCRILVREAKWAMP